MKDFESAKLYEDKAKLRIIKLFLVKYVLLMLWIISMLLLFCKAYETFHHDDSFYYLRKILGRGLCISRGTAPLINLIVVLIMLPVCKTFNKLVHKILSKLSVQLLAYYLEKLKIIHLCLAVTLVFTAVIHSLAHFWNIINFIGNYDLEYQEINWAKDETDNMFRLLFFTPTGFSGIIMLSCLIIIWIFSTRQMRNYFYNSFLGVHHLFLLFYVMMYYHPLSNIIKYQSNLEEYPPVCDYASKLFNNSEAANFTTHHCKGKVPKFTAGPKNFWIWPTIALLIYSFDLSFRYFKRCFTRLKPISMEPSTKSCMLITFKLNESITVRPGQYILLQCENLSKLEWHPFTITDFIHCPKRTILTVAIAVRGDWTYELYRRVSEHKAYSQLSKRRRSKNLRRSKSSIPRKLLFKLDGPFPSPMESIVAHEKVILVAAGIGITPFISIFNYMLKTTKMLPMKRIHLIWVSKDIEQFTLFSDILSSLTQTFWNENKPDKLQIRLYLTQAKPKSTRRISFPDEEDLLNDNELFGNNADFITSRLYSGRPNWSYLFNYWTSLYQKDIINVYSCGPKTLNKEIRQYCQRYNKRGFNYRYLHEAFS